jgi:hypothetical protein
METLAGQQRVDPDAIFGKIMAPDLDGEYIS